MVLTYRATGGYLTELEHAVEYWAIFSDIDCEEDQKSGWNRQRVSKEI